MTKIIVDRVQRTLGYGAFGTVVRAVDIFTNRLVAVKFFHLDSPTNVDYRHEERIYARLLSGCNPHIEYVIVLILCFCVLTLCSLFAAVLGAGMHRNFHYIVFEHCACTLYDVMKISSGFVPLPARHVMEIAFQLVRAIDCGFSYAVHVLERI